MFLFERKDSKLLYCIKASLLALVIAVGLTFIVSLFVEVSEGPQFEATLTDAFGLVILSPVLETLLMIPIIWIVFKLTGNMVVTAVVNALIWAVLHSLAFPMWGLFVFMSFVIFGIGYQVWRQVSWKTGALVAFGIHALLNSYVFLAMWLMPD